MILPMMLSYNKLLLTLRWFRLILVPKSFGTHRSWVHCLVQLSLSDFQGLLSRIVPSEFCESFIRCRLDPIHHYLQESRDELVARVEQIKQEVLGSKND